MTTVSSPNLYVRREQTPQEHLDRLRERRKNTPLSVQRNNEPQPMLEPVTEQTLDPQLEFRFED